MVDDSVIDIRLMGEEDTSHLGRMIAPWLVMGDVLLLDGPIGAGKTHLCRALIRERLGHAEDVPSPTFTLVQTYDADVEIWHADLYRLTHPDEALELGLQDAFDQAICLVEWPDRLGTTQPSGAIRVTLAMEGEGRRAHIELGGRADLGAALRAAFPAADRTAAAEAFLARAGWSTALRAPLAGDASARRYERLTLGTATRIWMDSPPGQADRVEDFAAIDFHLRQIGLNAPEIFDQDLTNGFLLLEDFGDGVFARLIEDNPRLELPLYQAATRVLCNIDTHPPAPNLSDLTALGWAEAAGMALEWYARAITGRAPEKAAFTAALLDTITQHADGQRVMILRDYHAENLMWLPERGGLHRVGLLDFQLAQMGQRGYDLVSLLQDARRDLGDGVSAEMIRLFLDSTGLQATHFMPAYAAMGAQRALRILGIFARLCLVAGKPGYVTLIPRVWRHLQANLAVPELAVLKRVCDRLLPAPTPAALARIEAQCGHFQ